MVLRCWTGTGTGDAGCEIWLTKLRFLPMACASLMRMPDGRLSSTSLKMRLYSATALTSSASSSAASDTGSPAAQPIDCLFDECEHGRIDRQFAQPACEEFRHTTRIAGHIS